MVNLKKKIIYKTKTKIFFMNFKYDLIEHKKVYILSANKLQVFTYWGLIEYFKYFLKLITI